MGTESSHMLAAHKTKPVFWFIIALSTTFLGAGLVLETWVPVVFILGLCAISVIFISSIKTIFACLFFIIPFSVEFQFSNGFSTDLPTEPIIIFLAYATLLLGFLRIKNFTAGVLLKPVSVLLFLHITWIGVSAMVAEDQVISVKYLLAKSWYILPFYVLPFLLKLKDKDYTRIFDFLLVGVLFAGLYFFVQHATEGLSFQSRTNAGSPIFRNHVNYACLLVISCPVIWYQYVTNNRKRRYILLLVIVLIFIYFSYARVAYACLASMLLGYFVITKKLSKLMMGLVAVAVISGSVYLINNNKFLDYAPIYHRTITQQRFDLLLEATYKMEDISSMERLHRWVAGINMIREKPVFGFGPGNFYNNYQNYTINSFQTYVSDNPDKSGIHNYYLMIAAEQGIFGLIIFLALLVVLVYSGEKFYHFHHNTKIRKRLMLGCLLIISIITMNLINDMIEVVKVGPFFFFACYLISRYSQTKITTQKAQCRNK